MYAAVGDVLSKYEARREYETTAVAHNQGWDRMTVLPIAKSARRAKSVDQSI
jgi:hypothetical protein